MEFTRHNLSMNFTNFNISMFQNENNSWFEVAGLVRSIFVILIASIGLFGNTLTMIVFLTKGMKNSSCSVFLAALAFVDNTFLLSLLLSWIDTEIIAVLKSDFACQIIIFITYVTSFLSVWFIVGFTCERFVAICFPLKGKEMCNMFREKLVVLILTLLACLIYMFTFWTTGIEEWRNMRICSHRVEYFLFLKVITWMDTFLTMIIPFCVISVVNCLILRTVRRCPVRAEQRRQCRNKNPQANKETDKTIGNKTRIQTKRAKRRRTPLIRVTKTLIFVSTTFLLLNLPSHMIRIYNLLTVPTDGMGMNIWFYIIQELSLLLYYSTFSCNFVLYTLFGRNFKRSLIHILKCHKSIKQRREQIEVSRKKYHLRLKTSSL